MRTAGIKYWCRILVYCLFLVVHICPLQGRNQDVLAPEDWIEARLNRLQPPGKVMDAIGVKPGMVVAEIGAGKGRYVVQLAVRVGKQGKVYAEDINVRHLEHLKKRCRRWGLLHVETILGDITDPKLPDKKLDLIFIISAYHHFDDPVALLRNARPSLKKNGLLAIGEWYKPGKHYATPKEIEKQMNKAGFKLERIERVIEKNGMLIHIFRRDDYKMD